MQGSGGQGGVMVGVLVGHVSSQSTTLSHLPSPVILFQSSCVFLFFKCAAGNAA